MENSKMHAPRGRGRRAVVFAVLFWTATLGLASVGQLPAEAAVNTVKGYACGYYTNVGLFGGPQAKLGCAPQLGQPFAPATAATLSPSVELPPTGSATPITVTDPDGATGKYGPAVIFGGVWPPHVGSGPPSGPITVSTQGTTGVNGSVTASTDIRLNTPANADNPGGFGPMPVWGDSLHVECSATETSVSGSTSFTNSFIAKATDSDGEPLPSETEAIPANPPPNYTRSGVITNVGDVFTAVFNEQIINPDGSLTVNAVHMYLFGPVAVGDMVKGQVTCGTNPTTVSPNDTIAPHCGIPVVEPMGPDNPTPRVPRRELQGVFDAGGIQSVTNVHVVNGTVQVGTNPGSEHNYLRFVPGQKGPLALIATRSVESRPMTWSFDVTDMSGNSTHCTGVVQGTTTSATSMETGQSFTVSSVAVPSAGTDYIARISTRPGSCQTGAPLGGAVLSTGSFTMPSTTRVIPTNMTPGERWVCWVSSEDSSDHSTPVKVVIF